MCRLSYEAVVNDSRSGLATAARHKAARVRRAVSVSCATRGGHLTRQTACVVVASPKPCLSRRHDAERSATLCFRVHV
eukprot:1492149-Prymnesium_polylepis.1